MTWEFRWCVVRQDPPRASFSSFGRPAVPTGRVSSSVPLHLAAPGGIPQMLPQGYNRAAWTCSITGSLSRWHGIPALSLHMFDTGGNLALPSGSLAGAASRAGGW